MITQAVPQRVLDLEEALHKARTELGHSRAESAENERMWATCRVELTKAREQITWDEKTMEEMRGYNKNAMADLAAANAEIARLHRLLDIP